MTTPTKIALIFNNGGIGDYINWTPSVRWVIENHKDITGYVAAPIQFIDLARLWFRDYAPRFLVHETKGEFTSDETLNSCDAWIVPDGQQLANACGFHLMHLGWVYYMQKSELPTEMTLPLIRGDEADISRFNLPENYVVITTLATSANRQLRPSAINETTDWLISQGITPVFLGKKELTERNIMLDSDGVRYDRGLDLREKTSLTEAAVIMHNSRATIGLDNGLLHLAACTKTTVIWVFTTIDPKFRISPRPHTEARTSVLVPGESLTCRFCNSKYRYEAIGHDFKHCLRGDNACTEMITSGNLISALEGAL